MIRTTYTQRATAPPARPCCRDTSSAMASGAGAGSVGFISIQPATQPGFDWKKWLPIIALAVAALLLLTGEPKKKRRRKALKKASAGYRRKVGAIQARYA